MTDRIHAALTVALCLTLCLCAEWLADIVLSLI